MYQGIDLRGNTVSALKYWLWLTSLRQIGPASTFSMIEKFGTPENVFFADNEELRAFEGLSGQPLEDLLRRDLDMAERILEQCDKASLRVMTLQDADYPERLKNIHVPPSVLYIKGRLPTIDEEAALAIVGMRNPTPYGLQVAGRLSYGLARAGMLIVSGLAAGIDAAAHAGAIRAGMPTVAIMGCGADIAYPYSNRALYEDIATVGAIISEYPPGTSPIGSHFPVRNRIISGMSLGTLVVEATERSGALITVRHALDQGRDVFAVPGNIDVPESVGCNRLLREGAQIVTEPGDILQEYLALYPHKISLTQKPNPSPIKPAKNNRRQSSQTPKTIDLSEAIKDFNPEAKAIMISLSGGERHVDEIGEQTGLPAAQILRELTMLELNGAVKALPGKRYTCTLEASP